MATRKVVPFIKPMERITLPSSWAAFEPHMQWPEMVYAGRMMAGGLGRLKLDDLPVSAFDTQGHREYFTQRKEK